MTHKIILDISSYYVLVYGIERAVPTAD
jgi:hypothetical protein